MNQSEGSASLRAWLEREDTPTQYELADILPKMHQPTISRHACGGIPGLKMVLWYELIAGIPPEAWLPEGERTELQQARVQGWRAAASRANNEAP